MDIFNHLEKKWGSTIVARSEVGKFSGGLLCAKTLANLDSLGEGPEGRFRIGRRVGYDVSALVEWMRAKAVDKTWKASQESVNE